VRRGLEPGKSKTISKKDKSQQKAGRGENGGRLKSQITKDRAVTADGLETRPGIGKGEEGVQPGARREQVGKQGGGNSPLLRLTGGKKHQTPADEPRGGTRLKKNKATTLVTVVDHQSPKKSWYRRVIEKKGTRGGGAPS